MTSRLRLVPLILAACAATPVTHAADPLADGFRQPPAEARPQTWWHWMNGNISKAGITADLEAMQRIGLRGAQVFNATQGEAAGPVKVFSPEWYELAQFAIQEANRLGLELTFHNCAGWSESGGPWVPSASAMRRVVWSELRVHGPAAIDVALPPPTLLVAGDCADIAVLAFPANPAETAAVADSAAISARTAGVDLRPLLVPGGGLVELPLPAADRPELLTITFPQPQRCGSVRLVGKEYLAMPLEGRVEVSEDGQAFRRVAEFPQLARGRNHPSTLVTFPETTARAVRIVVTKVDARAKALLLTAIELGGARLAHTEERAAFRADAQLAFLPETVPADEVVARANILDLTAQVKNGRLTWRAPAGAWTIVRFAHTPTGQMNAPAPEGGRGWEADKLSRTAVDAHFAAMMGRLIAQAGPLAGKSLKGVLADSWEAGSENWTPAFRAEFQRRRGYDPLPFLPVVEGRVVESVEVSQRFLWDYRRTIGDLIAENHYAEFRRLAAAHGMAFWAEAPGINMPTVADELECKGRTDVPMGEFWMDGHNDTKETASAAHIYGRRLAAAEAFTAKTEDAKWTKAPFDHKMLGDLQFTVGINEFVFHRYAHQPWLDRVPGMSMGRWGTNFERTNTWWEQARAWIAYLTRCQYLLQSGVSVADVCYFYGENVPNTLARHEPVLPAGYDYDACNAEVLLTRAAVRDGRIVLPDGVSYAVLLLRDSDRMSPELLRKLKDLVAAGATVIGRRPERSPSLVGYPGCDDDVRALAAELWGNCDGTQVTEHAFGRGRVIWGQPIADVLRSRGIAPDFLARGDGRFAAIHRRIRDADIYFVSSQNPRSTSAVLSFRGTGRVPELWSADTAEIRRSARFSTVDGRTEVPVTFDPAGSVFVVFRSASAGLDSVVAVTGTGAADPAPRVAYDAANHLSVTASISGEYRLQLGSGAIRQVTVRGAGEQARVDGPWTVAFPAGWDAPASVSFDRLISWPESPVEGVKYFSGTATYTKDVELPATAFTAGATVWLDLGMVKELAEVAVNGRPLGVLWKPPFRTDITGAAHPGINHLEIKVTNLWPNRMIGDVGLPEAKRHTWSTFNPFKADSPLLPSGLLGPVTITTDETVTLE